MSNQIGSALLFPRARHVFDANRNRVLDPGEMVTSTEDFRFTGH
jgi:hypothetical protein